MRAAGGAATEAIRRALRLGDRARAEALLRDLIGPLVKRDVGALEISCDRYSLNSVHGFVDIAGLGVHFFKFHHEENEEQGVGEYYNAQVLEDAGYSVDRPLFAETAPGRQILLYRKRDDPRLSDVCSELDKGRGAARCDAVIATQRAADKKHAAIACRDLHMAALREVAGEPIFQLFFNRLVDDPHGGPDQPLAGRVARFYAGRQVTWPGLTASFEDIAACRWRINALDYPVSLGAAFEQAKRRLHPAALAPGPAFAAHGDAHNANVWLEGSADGSAPRLTLFDPAFAGRHVPALLAEAKASFHNVFAHPFWLYEPDHASTVFTARASKTGDLIEVETDYRLSALRRAFLESKAECFWRPLLAELRRRGWLADNWRQIVRSALFCCPTLVMNLLATEGSSHTPVTSLIAFSQAIKAAVGPANGAEDDVEAFLRLMDAERSR